jgi:hypothetical protein
MDRSVDAAIFFNQRESRRFSAGIDFAKEKEAVIRHNSDEEFFVLGGGVRFGIAPLLPANEVEPRLQAFQHSRRLIQRLPEFRPKSGTGVFDYFESPRKDLICASHLDAEALDRVGENAIHFLGLPPSQVSEFRSVTHNAGDARLGIFENPVRSEEDGVDSSLKLGGYAREILNSHANLEKHCQ